MVAWVALWSCFTLTVSLSLQSTMSYSPLTPGDINPVSILRPAGPPDSQVLVYPVYTLFPLKSSLSFLYPLIVHL